VPFRTESPPRVAYVRRMDWSTLLGTVMGAVIGIGATLLADRARWRRDHDQRQIQIRRDTYTDFLTALSLAHSTMRTAALREYPDGAVVPGTFATGIEESGIWRVRQRLSLCAPAHVIGLAMTACEAMVGIQDALKADPDPGGEPYLRARAALWAANAELREAMRGDLGVLGPPDPEAAALRSP
jgi:hypothetical protein